jgi:hypothetical protein
LVRNVLNVKPIPNPIPHINIHKSTPKTPRVIENPVISITIFTVLLITQISSSFPSSSQRELLSKYQKSLTLTILDITNVKIITITAKITFKSTSVENNPKIVAIKLVVCSTSFSPAIA